MVVTEVRSQTDAVQPSSRVSRRTGRRPQADRPRAVGAPESDELKDQRRKADLTQKLINCKILIGHQARQIHDQWMLAKKHKETEQSLEQWMIGKRVGMATADGVLQIQHAGQQIRLMTCDFAERLTFNGLGYSFTVARQGDIVIIRSLTETWIRS
jgi:hypothetical protein